MKYEIRIRNYEKIRDVAELRPDIIGVGDEGCFYRLPSAEDSLYMKKTVEDAGLEFRLITPKIFQNHIEEVLNVIERLSHDSKKYYLTINDLGLLHACHKRGITPENVTLGRGMTRSFIECPWYENFLRDEDEELQRTITQNYMAHKIKIDFFNKYGIDSIEANMVKNQEDAYGNIADNGWKINVHYGYMTVSFSRICQTAKYHRLSPPECMVKCNDKFTLGMSQIHTKRTNFEISEEARKRVPEFILKGNILYRENPLELAEFNIENVDILILSDIQFPAIGELSMAYEIIQGVIKNE